MQQEGPRPKFTRPPRLDSEEWSRRVIPLTTKTALLGGLAGLVFGNVREMPNFLTPTFSMAFKWGYAGLIFWGSHEMLRQRRRGKVDVWNSTIAGFFSGTAIMSFTKGLVGGLKGGVQCAVLGGIGFKTYELLLRYRFNQGVLKRREQLKLERDEVPRLISNEERDQLDDSTEDVIDLIDVDKIKLNMDVLSIAQNWGSYIIHTPRRLLKKQAPQTAEEQKERQYREDISERRLRMRVHQGRRKHSSSKTRKQQDPTLYNDEEEDETLMMDEIDEGDDDDDDDDDDAASSTKHRSK